MCGVAGVAVGAPANQSAPLSPAVLESSPVQPAVMIKISKGSNLWGIVIVSVQATGICDAICVR